MNAHHDLERRLADFYDAEAPRQAPDRVLHAALDSIDTTRQRRALIRVPRRFQAMNTFARAAIAATAVIVVGAIGLALVGPFRPAGNGVGGVAPPSPSSSQSPSASPGASAQPLPPLTGSFTSAVYGVSASYPAGWTIHRATQLWTTSVPWACMETCGDYISGKETDAPFFAVASQPLAGKSGPEWVAATLADPGWEGRCAPVTESVTIDGTAGTLARICASGPLIALTSSGGRGYAFVLFRIDDISQFKQILATVRLQPADAKDVMASPAASPSAS